MEDITVLATFSELLHVEELYHKHWSQGSGPVWTVGRPAAGEGLVVRLTPRSLAQVKALLNLAESISAPTSVPRLREALDGLVEWPRWPDLMDAVRAARAIETGDEEMPFGAFNVSSAVDVIALYPKSLFVGVRWDASAQKGHDRYKGKLVRWTSGGSAARYRQEVFRQTDPTSTLILAPRDSRVVWVLHDTTGKFPGDLMVCYQSGHVYWYKTSRDLAERLVWGWDLDQVGKNFVEKVRPHSAAGRRLT